MKRYLITDPRFYPSDITSFSLFLRAVFAKNRLDFASLRGFDRNQSAKLAPYFVEICHEFNVSPLINFDIDLALKLNCGIHLKSSQFLEVEALKDVDNLLFYSAHSLDEILCLPTFGVDAMTISPIFATPNKGAPLGLEILRKIPANLPCDIFALGGIITQSHVDMLARYPAISGFASIRFFINKTQ